MWVHSPDQRAGEAGDGFQAEFEGLGFDANIEWYEYHVEQLAAEDDD
jgi:hypothetical protein